MAAIRDVIADALRSTFNFIGQAIQYSLGLLGVIIVSALTAMSGEVLDDITTYKSSEFDYAHLVKVIFPPIAIAVIGYIQHRRAVGIALATTPPETQGK
jgi:hypothetical protein